MRARSIETPIHLFRGRCTTNARDGFVGDPSTDAVGRQLVASSCAVFVGSFFDFGRVGDVLRLELDRRAFFEDLVAIGF